MCRAKAAVLSCFFTIFYDLCIASAMLATPALLFLATTFTQKTLNFLPCPFSINHLLKPPGFAILSYVFM